MSETKGTAPDWSKEAVVRRLRDEASTDELIKVQVFLKPSNPDVFETRDTISDLAAKILAKASQDVNAEAAELHIGKISPLAMSFSAMMKGDVLQGLARSPDVRSILPNEIDDIFPKPV